MELSIISFNILCCDGPEGYAIRQRAPRVTGILEERRPDLIGFQEATPLWLEILQEDLGAQYEIYNVWRGANSHESTPIAWRKDRFDCLEQKTLWFSDTPEQESRGWDNRYPCPRIVSLVRLKDRATGGEFIMANTHFGFGEECQTKSARMLTALAQGADCPFFVTGDFNMEPDAPGYAILTRYFTDANAALVNDLGHTFHGFDPERFGEHIDYCFTAPGVNPLSFRVIRDQVDGKYPSDHHPLLIRVAL